MAEQDRDWQGVLDEEPDLHRAAGCGDLHTLKCLLESGDPLHSVNLRNRMHCTPLRVAAKAGAVECVQYLLAHGAEVDAADFKAQTPLFMAVAQGHTQCTRVLLAAGACPNGHPNNLSAPICLAAQLGHLDIIHLLVDHKACLDPGQPNFFTSSSLSVAASQRHWACFMALLQGGASPSLATPPNTPSLFHRLLRAEAGVEPLEALWECGGSVWVQDKQGRYPHQVPQDEETAQLLTTLHSCPRTLLSSCRLAVRAALGPSRLTQISCLPLPSKLHAYLNFEVFSMS